MMIELLCLSYTLAVATGNFETTVELENQDCYLARQVCELEGGDWQLTDNPFLSDYLAARWQIAIMRRAEVRDIECDSTIPLLKRLPNE